MKRLSEIRDFNSYLNTENDRTIPARSPEPTHFNSRSLCRKRQLFVSVKVWYPIFQSTFPMQGTTSMRLISKTICLQFQSTFPMQGTTSDMQRLLRHKQFQSTFPMQGTTVRAPSERVQRPDFNPRSQCRERQQTYPNINLKQHYICNILRFSFNIFSSLIYIVIQYSIFVQLFWCESPGIFMYTSYSHYQIAV